ncbi:MAG: siderophore-interacting protein [Henriciella sp.]
MKKKPNPKSFKVLAVDQVTPNMRNVSLGGPAMQSFPASQEGGYVKLILGSGGLLSKPLMRTYTIRRQSADQVDVEFALHGEGGEGGPAVQWAVNVAPGDEIVLGGPGPAKPLPRGADWYFVVGDMTALPAIAVNLAALPADAKGDVVIEVQSAADEQSLSHPEGVRIHWVHNPHPGQNVDAFEQKVRSIPWRDGVVYAWAASEFEMMRRTRTYLRDEKGLGKDQLYISSYWKKGANEDAHKKMKRQDAMSHS